MPLHLKYRPNRLDEVQGNESVKTSIQTILSREDRPKAWLFIGPSGCGKTTLARIIANEMGCHERDYNEFNISDARGIDDAREIMKSMVYMPQAGKVRVFVLDEIQQATKDFQNSILKALEDTPRHVVFILCTTDPDKLLKTIRTRCSTFEMRPLPGPVMFSFLQFVTEGEGIQGFPPKALEEIVKVADGSPRQALVILDQVIDIVDDNEMLAAIQRNAPSEMVTKDLCQALLRKAPWEQVSGLLRGMAEGEDPEKVRRAVLGYMTAVLLNSKGQGNYQAATVIECFKDSTFSSGKAGLILMAFRAVLA